MKKFLFVVLVFALGIYLYGCGKKQQTLEEMQQPMSMETLTSMNTTAPTAAPTTEVKTEPAPVVVTTPTKAGKLESLPPAGPYKPTNIEIQTALKNANFYIGEVDGKFGPKTKKAISDFQKANGLSADGKVGPKTWGLLSKFLNLEPTTVSTSKSR